MDPNIPTQFNQPAELEQPVASNISAQPVQPEIPVAQPPIEIQSKPKKTKFILVVSLGLIILIILLWNLLFVFKQPFKISGSAMLPNYKDGEYFFTDMSSFKIKPLSRNDVIVFSSPEVLNKKVIKRIIGISGDKILLKDGSVFLNGQLLNENETISNSKTYGGTFLNDGQEIIVPLNQYFVMGDNREHSADSRIWGFIPLDKITGRVGICYFNCK
jgi:signal peptidase I